MRTMHVNGIAITVWHCGGETVAEVGRQTPVATHSDLAAFRLVVQQLSHARQCAAA